MRPVTILWTMMIVLFKCNPEVLTLSVTSILIYGRPNVTNERALWARTPLPVRPLLSFLKRSTSFYIFVLFSKGMRTKTRMLIRRIRRVLRDAGRNMEGATLNLLKRTNTAGKDGTEQKWPSASLKRHLQLCLTVLALSANASITSKRKTLVFIHNIFYW